MHKNALIGIVALLLWIIGTIHPAQAAETAAVSRVTDGDTLKVVYRGQSERVSLVGVDAPESSANDKAERNADRSGNDLRTILAQGKKATGFVKTLVNPGDIVRIEFDAQERDRYGPLLGYVFLGDGRILNEEIARAGYAGIMTVPPNVKYHERLLKAFREARDERRGLWEYR